MSDFENNFDQYLKHLDLVQKNEPEKFRFIKEISDSFTDIDFSRLIETTALSFEKNKKEYSEITSKATKEIFLQEQIQLYIYANHRFKRFGDYANEMFDKYKPVFIEALEYWTKKLEDLKSLTPQPGTVEGRPEQETKKVPQTLSELITHENSVDIVRNIKIQYKNIKGKRLKLLLIALQELELLPEERIAKKFHTFCKNEFDWDIASYNAMNVYIFNEIIDNEEFKSMIDYLKTLIEQNRQIT